MSIPAAVHEILGWRNDIPNIAESELRCACRGSVRAKTLNTLVSQNRLLSLSDLPRVIAGH